MANEAANEDLAWNEAIMRFCSKYFHNLYPDFVVPAFVVSYLFFFGIGGYLHVSQIIKECSNILHHLYLFQYTYYYKKKSTPEEWKCQPKHWLSWDYEKHEIIVGAFSLSISSGISALLACYVVNGGPSTVYYGFWDKGVLWWFLQWPVIFILQVVSLINHVKGSFVHSLTRA